MAMEESRLEGARRREQRIEVAWNGKNRSSMVMGWVGLEMERENDFGVLGYEDQHAYRKAKGYGRSTWYKMLGIAREFAQLAEEQFLSMKVDNAYELSMVKEEAHRYDPVLIAAAATDGLEDFCDRMADREAARTNIPMTERKLPMKFHLTRHQREAVMNGLQRWMQDHQIKSEGYALEMLVAEYTERLTLVGYYKESMGRMQRAASHCAEGPVREELMSMASEMQEALDLVIGEKASLGMAA